MIVHGVRVYSANNLCLMLRGPSNSNGWNWNASWNAL